MYHHSKKQDATHEKSKLYYEEKKFDIII